MRSLGKIAQMSECDQLGLFHIVPTEVIVDHHTLSWESSASRFRIGCDNILFLARSEGSSGSITLFDDVRDEPGHSPTQKRTFRHFANTYFACALALWPQGAMSKRYWQGSASSRAASKTATFRTSPLSLNRQRLCHRWATHCAGRLCPRPAHSRAALRLRPRCRRGHGTCPQDQSRSPPRPSMVAWRPHPVPP